MRKTHDYTNPCWGHDLTFEIEDGGRRLSAMGWGHGIRDGDFILIENKNPSPGANSSTRYRFTEVKYLGDPSDMWSATLIFAPRTAPGDPASARAPAKSSCMRRQNPPTTSRRLEPGSSKYPAIMKNIQASTHVTRRWEGSNFVSTGLSAFQT